MPATHRSPSMNSTTTTPALTVDQLQVDFKSARGYTHAVDKISFQLQPGTITALVGESGCGKSTTAMALMGLLKSEAVKVQAKQVLVGEQRIDHLDEAQFSSIRGRDLSIIFQNARKALDPVFTIGNQLSEVIRRHQNIGDKAARDTAANMLKRLGINPREMGAYPHQLSGGMLQRVMIAMAMVCKPTVLIADEPTSALDVTTQAKVLTQLKELSAELNTAVLLITHDLGVVAQSCDHAMVMYCGRIVESASTGLLFSQPRHPYTAGLIASVPKPDGSPLKGIPGQIPDLADLPVGCHFAPRCEYADTQCRLKQPTESSSTQHHYLCHHPLSS